MSAPEIARPVPAFTPTRVLTATINVAAATSATNPADEYQERAMPYDGWLAEVFIRWDDGANSLVGVRLQAGGTNDDGKKLVPFNPEDDFIALNDVSRTYPLWLPVTKDELLTVRVQNQDDSNGHAVPIDMVVARFVPELHSDLPQSLKPEGR